MIKKGLENQRKNSQQLELKNEKTLKEISKIKRLERARGITLIANSINNNNSTKPLSR